MQVGTETTMNANSNNLTMNNAFDNGYFKASSSVYRPNGKRPRVVQYDPKMGTEKSTLTVVLEQPVTNTSSLATIQQETRHMKISFGSLVVETKQHEQRVPTASSSGTNSQVVWITLVAQVPNFRDTRTSSGNLVNLSICSYDRNNLDEIVDHFEFGEFTYKQSNDQLIGQKKREASPSLPDDLPSKKVNANLEDDPIFNQLIATPFEDSPGKSASPQGEPSSQTDLNSQPDLNSQTGFDPMSSNRHQLSYTTNYDMINFSQGSSSGTTPMYDQQTGLMNMSSAPNFNYSQYPSLSYPAFSAAQHQQTNHNLSDSDNSAYGAYFNSHTGIYQQPLQPNLMMPHSSGMPPVSSSMMNGEPKGNPFSGIVSKAILKINGALTTMTSDWTPEEWNSGRRLVKFWRKQTQSNEVECGFEPISQEMYHSLRHQDNLSKENRKKGPLVVSCIYWRERGEFVITSVDCIYLLEGLIGVEFTVEEKNRIRRNLEGFKPLTVSKCKQESSEFFRLIMGFPFPKPRNIEKDVKVFPWGVLPDALKKIIKKYTPSFSSTIVDNNRN